VSRIGSRRMRFSRRRSSAEEGREAAAAATTARGEISTDCSYLSLSASPTRRNSGSAFQQVLTAHEPDTPWQRHLVVISCVTIYTYTSHQ